MVYCRSDGFEASSHPSSAVILGRESRMLSESGQQTCASLPPSLLRPVGGCFSGPRWTPVHTQTFFPQLASSCVPTVTPTSLLFGADFFPFVRCSSAEDVQSSFRRARCFLKRGNNRKGNPSDFTDHRRLSCVCLVLKASRRVHADISENPSHGIYLRYTFCKNASHLWSQNRTF